MHMLIKRLAVACFTLLCLGAGSSFAADTVMVGGAAMYPTKTIVENAVNSKDHTTLVAAVKAAGLVDTLNSKGRTAGPLDTRRAARLCGQVVLSVVPWVAAIQLLMAMVVFWVRT